MCTESAHHWDIAQANGRHSLGVCINCKPIATIIKNQFNKLQNINVSYIKGILGEGNSRKIITDLLC